MLRKERVAQRHEPRFHDLIFGWSFIVFDTHQESVIDDNRVLFDCRSQQVLPTFAFRFSQPISCCSMARVGWRLVTKRIWLRKRPPECRQPPQHTFHQCCLSIPQTKCLSPWNRRGSSA